MATPGDNSPSSQQAGPALSTALKAVVALSLKTRDDDKKLEKKPSNTMATSGGVVTYGVKLESRLNIKDLQHLKRAFMVHGDGYNNRLSVEKEEFCNLLDRILTKGNPDEYADLFDKIDVTKEGKVDWDKIASHLLLEYVEKDDRVKSTQVPQWKDIKILPSPHKDVVQKVAFLKNSGRYIAISKEGGISTWDTRLHLMKSIRINNDAVKPRDMWVTTFVVLQNINKIALAFTSKEIIFYDLSSKLEFNCQYRVYGLEHTPLSMDHWSNPNNSNEAIIVMGDTGGNVNAFMFTSAIIALFDRPQQTTGEGQEQVVNVNFKHLLKDRFKYCRLVRHNGHQEWARQVKYAVHLDCFISCSTTYQSAMVLGWIEKARQKMKTSSFNIAQGVNAFDYHEVLNLIATAGVNHHVCLWNPYVVSKPVGLLRGHMAPVMHVQFNHSRGQLISFSKDKVLRIWDVQLQVCLQRIAGTFPKGPDLTTHLFFHEERNRLFMTFNYQMTLLEMKKEVKDRVLSHEKPIACAIYSSTFNQVVSACQGSTVNMWLLDTGQKVKQFINCHGNSEITTLALDHSETRLFTGSTDGTVKVWDFNGHCHHTLHAGMGEPADISQIVVLKRNFIIIGWNRCITVFRNQQLTQFHVQPSEWKGGQEHHDDILAAAFSAPHTLATASYDGEIIIWNSGSEVASRRLRQRYLKKGVKSRAGTRLGLKKEGTTLSVTPSQPSASPHQLESQSLASALSRPPGPGESTEGIKPQRPHSRGSDASEDEQNDFIITRLVFLDARKGQSASGGANLVSCGGNGWVRFWNTAKNSLLAEYIAHKHVSFVVMAVSENNHTLVTGDTDGAIKVWNIQEYCMLQPETIVTEPPPLVASWQPHADMISSLIVCERNDRTLIISSSTDCSVQVWDIYGICIGTFGQEDHWKIEPFCPPPEVSPEEEAEYSDSGESYSGDAAETFQDVMTEEMMEGLLDPLTKVNTWEKTRLGKEYQELRSKKRERKQPGTIPELPYLHWEKIPAAPAPMGNPAGGPFAQPPEKIVLPMWTQALTVPELDEVGTLRKPDFITHPHRYFRDREDVNNAKVLDKDPEEIINLKNAYDERSLFPKYILEFEARMKTQHREELEALGGGGQGVGRGRLTHRRSKAWSMVASQSGSVAGVNGGAAKGGGGGGNGHSRPVRLSPLPEGKRPKPHESLP
ncbi:WD repeat-containing protein 49-like isoform X1 [Acanthaster planci]|uniref:WD repeat-containing protein 49-like isoform X1 n=1 Tax=Acanthaster planci TaxID=133434 RepID=A0A8B7YED4_ACAPL|nr:WD repeat-containing protein 49-like isoform X1 [Acanthaster planci]XP_022090761.1 WD repeat-containing protein 49-like isoform X1 [Acanthaster planci]